MVYGAMAERHLAPNVSRDVRHTQNLVCRRVVVDEQEDDEVSRGGE